MRELAEKAGSPFLSAVPDRVPDAWAAAGTFRARMRRGCAPTRCSSSGQLRQKFPKEMAEVEELRRTDPAAARAKMQELIKQLEADRPAGRNRGRLRKMMRNSHFREFSVLAFDAASVRGCQFRRRGGAVCGRAQRRRIDRGARSGRGVAPGTAAPGPGQGVSALPDRGACRRHLLPFPVDRSAAARPARSAGTRAAAADADGSR